MGMCSTFGSYVRITPPGLAQILFSSDGQWLASASEDKTVRLRHISDDRPAAHGYIEDEGEVEQGMLTAEGALIENAYNLSPQNAELLRQRGAR